MVDTSKNKWVNTHRALKRRRKKAKAQEARTVRHKEAVRLANDFSLSYGDGCRAITEGTGVWMRKGKPLSEHELARMYTCKHPLCDFCNPHTRL